MPDGKVSLLCTLLFDSEVDDGALCGDLWRIVWVAEFGGDVEAEIIVVLNFLVSQSDDWGTTYLDDGLVEDGIQGGVEFLMHILEKHGQPKLDGGLHLSHVVMLL